jgi:Zn-finger nucleic acid-binding protein
MQAQTLNCSSCGAAVSSDSPVCQHCGARLATMACPTCLKMMFSGSKFCPHCGAPAVSWEATPEEMPCPVCNSPLLRGQLGDSTLHQCGRCFGFWVDRATLERICREAEQQEVAPAFSEPPPPAPADGIPKVRYVPCPSCHALMNRVNFAECSGVVVDVCRNHGTWFDANELQRIVEFIRQGGMEKAREHQRAELAAERRRLLETRTLGSSDGPAPALNSGPDLDFLSEAVRFIGGFLAKYR